MKDLKPGTVVCPECALTSNSQSNAVFKLIDETTLKCQCGAKFRPIIQRSGKPLKSTVYKWNHTEYNWDEAEYVNGFWVVPQIKGFHHCAHNRMNETQRKYTSVKTHDTTALFLRTLETWQLGIEHKFIHVKADLIQSLKEVLKRACKGQSFGIRTEQNDFGMIIFIDIAGVEKGALVFDEKAYQKAKSENDDDSYHDKLLSMTNAQIFNLSTLPDIDSNVGPNLTGDGELRSGNVYVSIEYEKSFDWEQFDFYLYEGKLYQLVSVQHDVEPFKGGLSNEYTLELQYAIESDLIFNWPAATSSP